MAKIPLKLCLSAVVTVLLSQGAFARGPLVAPLPIAKPTNEIVEDSESEPSGVEQGAITVTPEMAREKLLSQLLRAAEAGIVTMQDDPQSDDGEDTSSAIEVSPLEPAVPDTAAEETSAADPAPAVNPFDVHAAPVSSRERPTPVAVAPSGCRPEEDLLLPVVQSGAAFSDKTAQLWSHLVGEFDRPDPGTAEKLVRHYLAVGLLDEARAVANQYMSVSEAQALLLDLADILEGKPATHPWVAASDCDGLQTVWSIGDDIAAARADSALAKILNPSKATRDAIEALPIFVRQALAAEFGLAAAKAGQWDQARLFDAMADRSARLDVQTLPGTDMLRAEVALWRDDISGAEAAWQNAWRNGYVKALHKIAEQTLRIGGDTGDGESALEQDLAIAATLLRGTDEGARSAELALLLANRSASRAEIMAELGSAVDRQTLPAERQAELLTELASKAASETPTDSLAMLYIQDPAQFADAMEHKAFRTNLVTSMLKDGLFDEAPRLFRPEDFSPPELAISTIAALLRAGNASAAATLSDRLPVAQTTERARLVSKTALGDRAAADAYITAMPSSEPFDTEAEIAALDMLVAESRTRGDASALLLAARAKIRLAPTLDVAREGVLLAYDSGADAIPEEIEAVLDAEAPDALAAYRVLFTPSGIGQVSQETAEADSSRYLDSLDQEISLFEEALEDG